jgi:hypothetical protein
MKRSLLKSQVTEAKQALYKSFPSRIIKNANESDCWHLKSLNGEKIVNSLCYFSDRGKKKVFFKIKRFSFEYFQGEELPDNLAVYSHCANQFCLNLKHHYASTTQDYLNKTKPNWIQARLGQKHKATTIALMSESHKGKTFSKESRKKMSVAKSGVRRADEVVERMKILSQGENNARAKLTEEDVIEIRVQEGQSSSEILAINYSVSASHVRSIWRRRCCKHI